jgi:hypothetical protein
MNTPENPPPERRSDTSQPTALAKAIKPPSILRKSAIILLLLVVVVFIAAFPLVIEPWLISSFKDALKARGMELAPQSKLGISVFGGRLSGSDIVITENRDGETRTVLSAKSLDGDIAMLDSLKSFDLIVDSLIATGATADLSRRKDGSVPVITPEDGGGIDWSKVDWYDYYKKISDYYKKRKEKEEEEKKNPPQEKPEPKAKPSKDWPKGTAYAPAPKPGERGPRVLIRTLKIEGEKLGLPDKTAFDVTKFTIDGSNVAVVQLPEEKMTLKAHLDTAGAGPIEVDLDRDPGQAGKLTAKAPELPAEVLTDKAIAGDRLAKYGAKGQVDVNFSGSWEGWNLIGALDNTVKNFSLNPSSDAGSEAQQAAQVIKQLGGKPIVWPIKIGGQLYAPTITDTGVDNLLKANKGALKDAATERATEEGKKLLEKQGEKNPELKKKADDLLKGLGR